MDRNFLIRKDLMTFMFLIVLIFVNVVVCEFCSINYDNIKVSFNVKADREDDFQVFYNDIDEVNGEKFKCFEYKDR